LLSLQVWQHAAGFLFIVALADIHSPQTSVVEALIFSARMRLLGVDKATALQFVEEVRQPPLPLTTLAAHQTGC
jgi:hypothetical protein